MTWNYRIVAIDYDEEVEYGIYEVYYDDDGKPVSRTLNPVPCVGSAEEELHNSFEYMKEAFGKPILTDKDFGEV